jgi:hypothetical protein|tara:strand:+ start:76 stop:534 length:459 start_codon:yes stop_codon:yes gene_type:complete
MAGAGYKLFASGDVLTASDVNTYLQEQTIMVFASTSARDTALNSVKSEGMFVYITGTNTLQFYDGSSWTDTSLTADITGVTTSATSGLSGGATSGDVTLVISPNLASSATVAGSDIVLIGDADDSNNLKKTTAQDIANLAGGVSLGLVIALS